MSFWKRYMDDNSERAVDEKEINVRQRSRLKGFRSAKNWASRWRKRWSRSACPCCTLGQRGRTRRSSYLLSRCNKSDRLNSPHLHSYSSTELRHNYYLDLLWSQTFAMYKYGHVWLNKKNQAIPLIALAYKIFHYDLLSRTAKITTWISRTWNAS